jgi:hypothetical protein
VPLLLVRQPQLHLILALGRGCIIVGTRHGRFLRIHKLSVRIKSRLAIGDFADYQILFRYQL